METRLVTIQEEFENSKTVDTSKREDSSKPVVVLELHEDGIEIHIDYEAGIDSVSSVLSKMIAPGLVPTVLFKIEEDGKNGNCVYWSQVHEKIKEQLTNHGAIPPSKAEV